MIKVFLGGTCAESNWREILKPQLSSNVQYFDPVVLDWNAEVQAEEVRQRDNCDYCLYVITKEMIGVYSIAEAVDDSNKRPHKTIFCVISDGFTDSQLRSLLQAKIMIKDNGAIVLSSLRHIAIYLNTRKENNV